MSKETGGPAFPAESIGVDDFGEFRIPESGMTLRDYFAAKAMQGLCTDTNFPFYEDRHKINLANTAYFVADAMLKAREA